MDTTFQTKLDEFLGGVERTVTKLRRTLGAAGFDHDTAVIRYNSEYDEENFTLRFKCWAEDPKTGEPITSFELSQGDGHGIDAVAAEPSAGSQDDV